MLILTNEITARMIKNDIETNPVGFGPNSPLLSDTEQNTGISPMALTTPCIVISAVCIPIQLLELGEEVGWRGFLLWHQVDKYGAKKAVLINGVEWGLAHMPLIYLGFNYSNDNPGAPWSNMALTMLLCIVMGITFSFVTLKTGNCMYAAIMHGVVNAIGEIPVFCSVSLKSGLFLHQAPIVEWEYTLQI